MIFHSNLNKNKNILLVHQWKVKKTEQNCLIIPKTQYTNDQPEVKENPSEIWEITI